MSRRRGTLKHEDEQRIIHNWRLIKEEIDASDLLDYLFEKGVFDQDDVDDVRHQNPDTRARRNDAFRAILLRSGVDAYKVFLESLKHYPHVVDTLTEFTLQKQDVSTQGVCEGKFILV
jgi:hypothetical protein